MTPTTQALRTATRFTALSLTTLFGLIVHAQQSPESAAPDSFAIPEKVQTIEQLFTFIEDIADTEPDGQTEQEMIVHHRKIASTVVAVADKVLSLEPNDKQAMQSFSFKMQALNMLQELGAPDAEEAFAKVVAEARKDSRSDVAAIGIKYFIEAGFDKWATLGEEDKTGLIDAIVQYVGQTGAGVGQLQLTLSVVGFLGDMQDEELAKRLLNALMPGFRKSDDERVQSNLSMLEGVARRINLPGSKMELTGTMLDGTPLDWSSYRGKVVLVDFWATWCGPCRAEVPNILKQFRAYHDKGFEVLGISLDKTAEDAESYIKQLEIPWATLFGENEQERGWQHPMARFYGVNGIPRAVLVDREGTVISVNARGKELARLLRKILGEPLVRAKPIEDGLVRQASDQTP